MKFLKSKLIIVFLTITLLGCSSEKQRSEQIIHIGIVDSVVHKSIPLGGGSGWSEIIIIYWEDAFLIVEEIEGLVPLHKPSICYSWYGWTYWFVKQDTMEVKK